jgi:hypothetical protein
MNSNHNTTTLRVRVKTPTFVRGLFFLAALVGLGQLGARAQSQDDVTVAFLYNFARFVEWPSTAFASSSTPFEVGFLGRPMLADKFAQAVQGKNVAGREFSVRKFDQADAAAGCHIVFVGDAAQAAAVIAAVKGRPVLCVGSGPEFLAAGGMIAFSRDGPRLVFDVNLAAIAHASMTPADKLAKAARSTTGG